MSCEHKTSELVETGDDPGYWDDCEDIFVPCTCPKECGSICRGECGCRACFLAYTDFLSNE